MNVSVKLVFSLVVLCLIFPSVGLLAQRGIPRIMINPKGHSAKINNILYTPDGNRIISVSEDKTIRIWNTESTELINKFESQVGNGSEGMHYAAAISPNGRLLAVAGYPVSSEETNYIIIIDIEQGVQVATARGHTNVINGMGFTADGKFLISGGDDGLIKIWNVSRSKTYAEHATIEVGLPVYSLSVSPKTNAVAIATESRDIWLYNLSGIQTKKTGFPVEVLKGHKDLVNKVSFSPNGKYIGSCSYNNDLALWSADGSLEFLFDEFEVPFNALAFSYDDRVFVAMDITGRGYSYSIPTGTLYTKDFKGHDNTVFSAAFSPKSTEGNYVIASAGGTQNEILTWNAISGKTVSRIKGKGSFIGNLSFGTGMELYISTGFNLTGKPKYQYSFDFNTFSVKKDPGIPRNALSTPKDVKETNDPYVLQLPRGKSIMNNDFEDGIIRSWAVTTDNRILVGSDFSLKMYDMNGNLTREFLGHTGGIYSLAISPDGRYFASGSDDQTIKLWKFDETGHAPSLLQYFEGEDDVLAILNETESDAVLREESRSAWQQVINKSKDSGNNKLARFLQEEFNNIGENIIPFASLFLTEDLEWVCWVPTGYFACSTNGADYFGWHLNNGIEELATFYSADQYFELLYRPVTLNKSIVQAKRVKEILSDEGEIIFDLSKLSRPSAGFFDTNNLTIGENKVLDYENGKYNTTINQLPLTVDIYDGGGGIREVNIYHNGKLLIHDTEVKSIRQNANFKKTYPVNLVNETNNFKVVVVNYQRIESRPDYLKIEYIGEQIITATLHVLSIGINQYQKEEYNLNYAYSDAQSFTDKIIGNSKSIFKGVRSKIELYDQQATRENIIKGFESIIAVAKPEDMFVFYYAGHGTIDEETNEYYLVPTNITQLYGDAQQLKEKGISASELKQMLANVKSTKQLILMDACHSGAAVEAFKAKDEGKKERAITNLARSSGVAMLTSSNSQQFATEFDSLKHGVFTYSLLEALDGKADTGDDQVSVYELKLYMERVVPILSKQFGGVRQRPIAHVFGNDFPVSVITKKEEVEEGDDGGR